MKRTPIMAFAGEFWAGASGSGLSEGFRDLGWAVQEVDSRDFGARPGKSLAMRVASRLTREISDAACRQSLLDECRMLRPDIFLTIKGAGITRDLLHRVRETGARTVMYYPDFHFDHPGVSTDSFDAYDLFITTKTFQTAYLEDLLGPDRVAYVPHGFSDRVHRPVYSGLSEADFQADVVYVGNHSAYTQAWLEGAASLLPECSFRIVGNRWQAHVAGSPLERCALPGARVGVAYAEAIQTSRINVAVHFGPTASGWQDLVSTQTFEIPACKGFMLHIDNEEVREFFEPGTEIDVFSSPEELSDKIRFYLARPDLRMQMIERAYERCVPSYGYIARASAINDILSDRLLTGRNS